MTEQEFHGLWTMITNVARTAQFISVEQAQELYSGTLKSQTLGPLLYPTEYIRGGSDNLTDQRKLLEGFLAFRRAIEQVKMDALERMAK